MRPGSSETHVNIMIYRCIYINKFKYIGTLITIIFTKLVHRKACHLGEPVPTVTSTRTSRGLGQLHHVVPYKIIFLLITFVQSDCNLSIIRGLDLLRASVPQKPAAYVPLTFSTKSRHRVCINDFCSQH